MPPIQQTHCASWAFSAQEQVIEATGEELSSTVSTWMRQGSWWRFRQPDRQTLERSSQRLDVPVIPKLLKSLKENGVDVSMAYSYSDAEAALLKAFGKRL